jgi:hypothetical protein
MIAGGVKNPSPIGGDVRPRPPATDWPRQANSRGSCGSCRTSPLSFCLTSARQEWGIKWVGFRARLPNSRVNELSSSTFLSSRCWTSRPCAREWPKLKARALQKRSVGERPRSTPTTCCRPRPFFTAHKPHSGLPRRAALIPSGFTSAPIGGIIGMPIAHPDGDLRFLNARQEAKEPHRNKVPEPQDR